MTIETKGNVRPLEEEEEELKKITPVAYERGFNAGLKSETGQNMSVANRREIQNKRLNPDNLETSAARSQKKKLEGKQPSVSDQFFEAIGFFMPTIVGGLVGGAMEGSEGALAGAELGMKAGKQFADYKEAQQKRLATAKVDITPEWVDKETGEPRFTKQIGGMAKFVDEKGNVVSAKSVENMRSRDARERENRLREQYGTTATKDQLKRATNIVKDFSTKNEPFRKQIMQLDLAKQLIKKGALSRDQLATFNAGAIFQEARKTDEDVTRAITSQSVRDEIFDRPVEALTGKLGPRRKKEAIRIFDIIRKKMKSQIIQAADIFASPLKVRSSGLSKKDLVEEFIRSVGVKRSKKMTAKQRRKLEELRKKYNM